MHTQNGLLRCSSWIVVMCLTCQVGPILCFVGENPAKSQFQVGSRPFVPRTFHSWPSSSSRLFESQETKSSQEGAPDAKKDTSADESQNVQNSSLLRLAKLSLEDYEWRSSALKSKEADRKVEETLARMMGDEASYVRPMDASEEKIGPLGLLEKSTFDWFKHVIDEEARRAKKIVLMGGMMVRPIDVANPDEELGPLGMMEKAFVEFLESIRKSERERKRKMVLRPKDLDDSTRGPLGDAELRAVAAIREILESEKVRAAQSRKREGVVRPIDVPGPLGNWEMTVLEVVRAEQQRSLDKKDSGKLLVRPKDSTKKGPLGELEEQAVAVVKRLTNEEKQRLRNIQKYLDENRPMEQDKNSLLGMIETIAVGIVRAPILLFQIISRVKELMESETLAEEDAEIIRRRNKMAKKKKNKKKD